MKVERFEDILAWQKARILTKAIYKITNGGNFKTDIALKNQIRRACVSIMSSIAEGFERETSKDNHHFIVIAKASCSEVRSQLYVAMDAECLSKEEFEYLMNLALDTGRLLGGLKKSTAARMALKSKK